MLDYQQTRFVMSAPDIRHLSDTRLSGFADRSTQVNQRAGTLTNQKSLARTSKPQAQAYQPVEWLTASVWLTCLDTVSDPGRMAQMARALSDTSKKRQSLQGLVVLMDVAIAEDLDQMISGR